MTTPQHPTPQKGATMFTSALDPHPHRTPRASTLRAAADVIEHGGHAKAAFATSDGRHCAVGAMLVATGSMFNKVPSVGPEIELLCEVLDLPRSAHIGLYGWNDAASTTGEGVVAVMRTAADIAELREQGTVTAPAELGQHETALLP